MSIEEFRYSPEKGKEEQYRTGFAYFMARPSELRVVDCIRNPLDSYEIWFSIYYCNQTTIRESQATCSLLIVGEKKDILFTKNLLEEKTGVKLERKVG